MVSKDTRPSSGKNRLQVNVLFLLGIAMIWNTSLVHMWNELGLKANSSYEVAGIYVSIYPKLE